MYSERFPAFVTHGVRNAPKLSKNAKIGIGVGLVALAAAWFFWPSEAKASPLPGPGPEPGPDPDMPEVPDPPVDPPQGNVKRDAPPYTWDAVNAFNQEMFHANAQHALWLNAMAQAGDNLAVARGNFGVPANRTVASWITDIVYKQMYPPSAFPIPSKQNQGAGWLPYIAAWKRTWEYVKGLSKIPQEG